MIVMISSLLPETNYTANLVRGLQELREDIYVYTDKNKKNLKVCKNVKLVYDKNLKYIFQIFWQALKDRPNLIHIQHEINMYGGLLTALLFPLLVLLLRLLKVKVIVTVHGVPPLKIIDSDFLSTFSFPPNKFLSFIVKSVFRLIFSSINLFSNKIIVHSEILKKTMVKDYFGRYNKIVVIRHGLYENLPNKIHKINSWWLKKLKNKKYVLYFGYVVKRKGLELLINIWKKNKLSLPLVIAGGTLKGYEDYLDYLKSISPKNIIFTSFINFDEINYLFSNAYFVVLPAKYSISASGPLSLALSYKKCVVVPSIGVFKEEITNFRTGVLYKDAEDLSDKINLLLKDQSLIKSIEKNLEDKISKQSWSAVAKQTLKLYKKLLLM